MTKKIKQNSWEKIVMRQWLISYFWKESIILIQNFQILEILIILGLQKSYNNLINKFKSIDLFYTSKI